MKKVTKKKETKGISVLLYFPDRKKYKFYQQIMKELGKSVSSRVWSLIELDLVQINDWVIEFKIKGENKNVK